MDNETREEPKQQKTPSWQEEHPWLMALDNDEDDAVDEVTIFALDELRLG